MTSTQTKTLYTSIILVAIVLGVLWYRSIDPSTVETSLVKKVNGKAVGIKSDPQLPNDANHQVNAVNQGALANAIPKGKVALLDEILKSGNDNDQRLDTELKNLTEQTKLALHDYYRSLKRENRNSLGTTVFLLGRNIKNEKDIAFMAEVINEPPCYSLEDCDFAHSEEHTERDNHDQSESVTLVYPQLVALIALQNTLKKPDMRQKFSGSLLDSVRAGLKHPSPKVRKTAERILEKYSK